MSVEKLERVVQRFLNREVTSLDLTVAIGDYREAGTEVGGFHPGRNLTASVAGWRLVYTPFVRPGADSVRFTVAVRSPEGYAAPVATEMGESSFVGALFMMRAMAVLACA